MYLKTILTVLFAFLILGNPNLQAQSIIIDHSCEDLTQIPSEWIDTVQENLKWHYAHTSHASVVGLNHQASRSAKSNRTLLLSRQYCRICSLRK